MRHWIRSLSTLLGAAAAGALLWYVPHFNRWTTGGYWSVMALMAAAGVVIGVSQLRGREGNPRAGFLLSFVPVLIASGWVLLASQPQGNWVRDHVRSWGDDLGIGHAVQNLGHHVAVVAFGLGVIFGLTFELTMLRRRPRAVDAVPPAVPAAVPAPVPPPADPAPDVPAPEPEVVAAPEPVPDPGPDPEPGPIRCPTGSARPGARPAHDAPRRTPTRRNPVGHRAFGGQSIEHTRPDKTAVLEDANLRVMIFLAR